LEHDFSGCMLMPLLPSAFNNIIAQTGNRKFYLLSVQCYALHWTEYKIT